MLCNSESTGVSPSVARELMVLNMGNLMLLLFLFSEDADRRYENKHIYTQLTNRKSKTKRKSFETKSRKPGNRESFAEKRKCQIEFFLYECITSFLTIGDRSTIISFYPLQGGSIRGFFFVRNVIKYGQYRSITVN